MVALARFKPLLLVIGAVLTMTGLAFSIAAIASPAWEIVDIREFHTQHEHGLWLDCARTVKTGIVNREPYTYYGERHCTYKFDVANRKHSGDIFFAQAPDSENAGHFEYKVHHISYMIMISATIISGFTALFIAFCACRSSRTAFVLIFTILTLSCAAISAVVYFTYFFVSHTVENRWIFGIISVYDTDNGVAWDYVKYATVGFLLAFIFGMILLKFFTDDNVGAIEQESIPYYPKNKQDFLFQAPSYQPLFPNNSKSYHPPYFVHDLHKSTSCSTTSSSSGSRKNSEPETDSFTTITSQSRLLRGLETVV